MVKVAQERPSHLQAVEEETIKARDVTTPERDNGSILHVDAPLLSSN